MSPLPLTLADPPKVVDCFDLACERNGQAAGRTRTQKRRQKRENRLQRGNLPSEILRGEARAGAICPRETKDGDPRVLCLVVGESQRIPNRESLVACAYDAAIEDGMLWNRGQWTAQWGGSGGRTSCLGCEGAEMSAEAVLFIRYLGTGA